MQITLFLFYFLLILIAVFAICDIAKGLVYSFFVYIVLKLKVKKLRDVGECQQELLFETHPIKKMGLCMEKEERNHW